MYSHRKPTACGHDAVAMPPGNDPADSQSTSKPIAISVEEFCRLSSLGRTSAFKLLRDGLLERRRVGGRTLVLMRSVEALLGLRVPAGNPRSENVHD